MNFGASVLILIMIIIITFVSNYLFVCVYLFRFEIKDTNAIFRIKISYTVNRKWRVTSNSAVFV